MPIATLFVEGNLDTELLYPILLGSPALKVGGSKNSLKPRVRTERYENRVDAGYLRDRDFDFDPPEELLKPTVDSEDNGVPVGWRWCRHEIENYLIDPAIVSEAMPWPIADVEEAIRDAARNIRNYEAARWTVGVVRRALPPHYKLETRPNDLNEIALPSALDFAAVNQWASSNIETHRAHIADKTDSSAVQILLTEFVARFDDDFVTDVAKVLLWFSGKDLLAGLADWLISKGIPSPGEFRRTLRDWIIEHPERAIKLLPEWNSLAEIFGA
jgi:hypothetical protein